MIDPFAFGETRGGIARAGELAGRAVLFTSLGDGIWELLDVETDSSGSEDSASAWVATDEARATINGWDIDWVPADETRQYAEKYFRNLDPSVAWGEKVQRRPRRVRRFWFTK